MGSLTFTFTLQVGCYWVLGVLKPSHLVTPSREARQAEIPPNSGGFNTQLAFRRKKKPRFRGRKRGQFTGVLGFEPRQADPESAVLPLHHTPNHCERGGSRQGRRRLRLLHRQILPAELTRSSPPPGSVLPSSPI